MPALHRQDINHDGSIPNGAAYTALMALEVNHTHLSFAFVRMHHTHLFFAFVRMHHTHLFFAFVRMQYTHSLPLTRC